MLETSRAIWQAGGRTPPAAVEANIARYGSEQKAIEHAAREKEHARDEASKQADELLERHHHFASSVALIQVAIALGAVAALSQSRAIWIGSLLLGGAGAAMFALNFVR